MSRTYRTATGKIVNIDNLILANEDTIAVGNMGVNARGDELGPGGVVATSRNQNMSDYYKLNTEVSQPGTGKPPAKPTLAAELTPEELAFEQEEPILNPTPVPNPGKTKPQLRGSLADSVAKEAVVTQPVITHPGQTRGPRRI
jgi:hypothetical protein